MSNESLLASVVRAAATETASDPGASTSQSKETPMAGSQNDAARASDTVSVEQLRARCATAEQLSAIFPDLVSGIRTEAATAERIRILGIENLGSQMKGHEKLIAEMKADAAVSPEAAAMRVLGAENALRQSQLQGVKDVESVTGKVKAAPSADAGQGDAPKFDATPDGWKAEYQANAKLQAEYPTAESYVATKRREALKVVGG